jgi:hypothetical protein
MKKVILALGFLYLISCTKADSNTSTSQNIIIPQTKTVQVILDSIKLTNRIDLTVVSNVIKYSVTGYYNDKTTKDLSDSVLVNSTDNTVSLYNKKFYCIKSGKVIFNINYKDFNIKDTVKILNYEFLTIPNELKSKNRGTIKVPVVIINYLPDLIQ